MPGGGPRILFAGGGTGGHLFPGLALARHASDSPVFWLSTSRPFDAEQLSRAGISFEPLPSPRWKGFRGFLGPLARSVLASARRIRSFRPDVVVGVGGYGTVPPAVAAKALNVPYVLLEQNVRPGRANRFLAPGAGRIYVQWPQARGSFPGCGRKVVVTGSPLRPDLRRITRRRALGFFGLTEGRPTVAVIGGSQGADVLNKGITAGLNGTARKIQIVHVTGKGKGAAVREAYHDRGVRAVVCEFVEDMGALYSAADLVVSRAGALAIAELAAFGVPSVLVPLSRSSGDHQRENARAVAKAGGALLMEERDYASGGLAPILQKLVRGDAAFDNMKRRLRPLARFHAAREVLEDLRAFLNT